MIKRSLVTVTGTRWFHKRGVGVKLCWCCSQAVGLDRACDDFSLRVNVFSLSCASVVISVLT